MQSFANACIYMFQVEFLPSRTCTDIYNDDLRLNTKCTACVTWFGKQINVHFREIREIKKKTSIKQSFE